MSKTKARKAWRDPAILPYVYLCLASLGVVLLVLQERGFGVWSFLPILATLAAAATSMGALILPLALTLSLNAPPVTATPLLPHGGLVSIPDILLCGAVLAYVIGHCRLQSLVTALFPLDPRLKQEPSVSKARAGFLSAGPRPVQRRRAARWVTRDEIAALVLALPLWVLLAQVVGRLLGQNVGNPWPGKEMEHVWRAILAAWLVGVIALVAGGLVGYTRRQEMTRDEAVLFLQDVVWKETRREQRRINRWLAWAKLRRQRREEP